jgi:ubiquinone/menaquinone biosynthesis C-methylase UbiE
MGTSIRDWERIYREVGDLQIKVLPKITRASKVFKGRDYKKILDLGCGTGKHSIFLAVKGFSVYGTDISLTGINIAKKKADILNLDNIRFKQHDMRSIPFANNFFDAVICIWTIYHGTLPEIFKTINEIYRVLRSDGMVITDFLSISDSTYGIGREIERNTFLGAKDTEEDVPHHYSTREELTQLFLEFHELKIRSSSNSYVDRRGQNYIRKYFNVQAIK